uniref:Uncharacterized protein n=1 Tax=Tetranychus urticae TaxID=32264 RepID=T1L4I2_TETUR
MIQRTRTSLYHLIPTFRDIKSFARLNENMTRNRTNVWQAIDVFDSLDKNIDIHCHYGTDVPTLSKLQYYHGGDGTVGHEEWCYLPKLLPENKPLNEDIDPPRGASEPTSDNKVSRQIAYILKLFFRITATACFLVRYELSSARPYVSFYEFHRSLYIMVQEQFSGDLYYDTVYDNLEREVTTTGQKGVLVCHSYGCLNLAELIRRKNAAALDDKIATIITLGAPWGGLMNALRAILSGDNLKKPYFNYRIFNMIQRTHTSLYHLIQSNGTLRFEDIVQLGDNMTRNRTNVWQAIDVFASLDKNIYIHCNYGTDVPKLSKLQYYHGGDGTVGHGSHTFQTVGLADTH